MDSDSEATVVPSSLRGLAEGVLMLPQNLSAYLDHSPLLALPTGRVVRRRLGRRGCCTILLLSLWRHEAEHGDVVV